ncbi:11038_t:CDS:2, partial [Scutellospora calospora]
FIAVPPIVRHAPGIELFTKKLLNNVTNLNKIILEIIQERRKYIDSLPKDNIEKFQYFDAFINEVLRLHPIFPLVPRSNSEPVEIGGYLWKGEQTFLVNYQGIHFNEKDWIDAEVFDPDRFLKNNDSIRSKNAEMANNNCAFVPFGGGAKSCPGRIWAVIEIKMFLIALLT